MVSRYSVGEVLVITFFFFFKQKTAYEMRISDWSSDVCSSDLCAWLRPRSCSSGSAEARPARHAGPVEWPHARNLHIAGQPASDRAALAQIGRASCRERGCQYV